MSKIPCKYLLTLQNIEVGNNLVFFNGVRPNFKKALSSFRTIEHRKQGGKLLRLQGNTIKRIA